MANSVYFESDRRWHWSRLAGARRILACRLLLASGEPAAVAGAVHALRLATVFLAITFCDLQLCVAILVLGDAAPAGCVPAAGALLCALLVRVPPPGALASAEPSRICNLDPRSVDLA